MADKPPRRWKSPSGLSNVVMALVLLNLGVVGLAGLLDPGGGEDPQSIKALTAGIKLIFGLVTLTTSMVWVYRCNSNAHVLCQPAADGSKTYEEMTFSPAWAVGWFFVPIAWLWKPFQVVREIWQVSADAPTWRDVEVPALLRIWWGLYLVYELTGNLTAILARQTEGYPALPLDIIETVFGFALSCVFIVVVRRITAMQVRAISAREFA